MSFCVFVFDVSNADQIVVQKHLYLMIVKSLMERKRRQSYYCEKLTT